jgi:hypothetical protein
MKVNIGSTCNSIYVIKLQRKYNKASNEKISKTKTVFNII